MVLRGAIREADGRAWEVILFTDKVTGKQTICMRFQTRGEELTARNEGLTLFAERQGGAAGRGEQSTREGPAKEAEKPKVSKREDKAEYGPTGAERG